MNYFQSSVNPHTAISAAALRTAPSMADVASFIGEGLVAPLVQGLSQVAVNFSDSLSGLRARPMRAARDRAHKHGCGCEAEDPCHCTCCIVDADLVVCAYLGERRIINLRIDNEKHREKEIHLELGPFLTRAGKPAPVKGGLLPPTDFKLGPCSSHAVVMVIESEALGSSTGGVKPNVPDEKIPDVEDCTVYYSDLRVDGCEMRPLRIALAILPRDCGAYKVHCHSCCC